MAAAEVVGKAGRAAGGESLQDGIDLEEGSLLVPRNCSGSLEKQPPSLTAAAAVAASRPGPREWDPAAGAPAYRRCVRRLAVKVAGCCRSSPAAAGRRCEPVSEGAGSHTGAPGGSGAERRWLECGLCGEKRAGAAD